MTDDPKIKPRTRRWMRRGGWTLVGLSALVLALLLLVASSLGTRVAAPDWLREQITSRVNSELEGLDLTFGDMAVVLEDGLVPRLMVRNVVLRDGAGTPMASLSRVQSTMALRPLLRGEVQPGTIFLSGAQLTLRRDAQGAVNLSLGANTAPVEEAANVAALVEQVDAFLQRPAFAALTAVEADSLTLRYEDGRAGQAWTVDGGRISMTRDNDDLRIRADLALIGARDYATTLELNYASRIGDSGAEIGITLADMPSKELAGQSPALSWLEALDAPISGAIRASVDQAGALGPLHATLQIGSGFLEPNETATPIGFDGARSYFTYDPATQVIQFDELTLDSQWVSATAEGQTRLQGMETGVPRELLSQLRVTKITVNPPGLYAKPLELAAATMTMRLQLDPFEVNVRELTLFDGDERFRVSGDARADADGWSLDVDGQLSAITPVRLMEIWPPSVKEKTRNWISNNVQKADLRNLQVAIRAQSGAKPDVFLGFDFSGMETRFMRKMPVITGGAGHASLYDSRFVIVADAGYVTPPQGGRIDIAGSSFEVPDVRIKRSPARVMLRTEATITATLSLLDHDPFNFLTKAGQPVTLADGMALLRGQLDFLLKDKLTTDEVAFSVEGDLTSVRSDVLVEGRTLAANALRVSASNTALVVGGTGSIGQVPFEGQWQADPRPGSGGSSTVSGWVELSERFADEFDIGLPPGSLSGAGRGDIEITLTRGAPGRFTLRSDLAGVGLQVRALDWTLGRATRGTLEVAGTLGSPPEISRLYLQGAGMTATGTVTLRGDGQLDRAAFSRVQLGSWIDAPVALVGRGAAAAPLVQVTGGRIDLRQTSLGGDSGGGSGGARRGVGGPVQLQLDRLEISEGIALTNFRADLDMSSGADGAFTGLVNGLAKVSGRVAPQDGRSAFRIQSDNAGGVLLAAGLLKQARNGRMDLVLLPGKGDGVYEGKLDISQLRVKDAPAMAALLNTISVVGLLEQLGGEGLHFAEVDARFQLSPDRVTLYSGSAVGASVGISMDGYYFLENSYMDMRGVLSPVYVVNMIGGVVARRGEGLIGFQYELKGPSASPKVSVNPLSVLTPGMFRELFRRPPPKPDDPVGADAAAGSAGATGVVTTGGTQGRQDR